MGCRSHQTFECHGEFQTTLDVIVCGRVFESNREVKLMCDVGEDLRYQTNHKNKRQGEFEVRKFALAEPGCPLGVSGWYF